MIKNELKKPLSPRLIVIVGETCSGKSGLAMDLAKRFNGEIISADSRAVYRGLDIGTAKPTKKDQTKVRHHLIDIIEPGESFSVAKFKKLANKAIKDIAKRGKLPILAGGSGLYIDSVIYDFSFNPNAERDPKNPRHALTNPSNKKLRGNTLIIGLRLERSKLESRLRKRVEQIVNSGLVQELKGLIDQYGPDIEVFRAPGYRAFMKYLNQEIDLEEAKELFVRYDLDLAKRQKTWFKRNKSIHWITNREQVVELVTTFLNK